MNGSRDRIGELPPEKLSLLLERLEERRATSAKPPASRGTAGPIPKRPGGGDCELSFAQKRLWFLHQVSPEIGLYNCHTALRIGGRFRVEVFRQALAIVVQRHEALRTSFQLRDGRPRQVVSDELGVPVTAVDLSGIETVAGEREVRRLVVESSRRPFDLASGPVLRAGVVRRSEREHAVTFCIHHIVSDAWSTGILVEEIGRLYEACSRGLPSPLRPLQIQYADFAVWQRRRMDGRAMEEHLEFWRERIPWSELGVSLPLDRQRPEPPTRRAGYHELQLDGRLSDALRALARREEATLFMVLLAGFHLLLHFFSGRDRVLVGSPIAGRDRPETEGLIGFFINTVVLPADLSGVPTFRELLGQVRETCLGAFARQETPFEKLVEVLRPSRSHDDPPLLQAAFTLQNVPASGFSIPGLEIERIHLDEGFAKFDLMLDLWEAPEQIDATFTYDLDVFRGDTVARLAAHYRELLARVAAEPSLGIEPLVRDLRQADHLQRERRRRETQGLQGSQLRTVKRKGVAL